MKPEHLARAAFEGMLCGLGDALDVLRGRGVEVRRVFLLGAAAELPAVQAAAPMLFGTQVVVPQPADYAAIGAARQAAWARLQGPDPRTPGSGRARRRRSLEPGEELRRGAGRAAAVRDGTGADAPRSLRAGLLSTPECPRVPRRGPSSRTTSLPGSVLTRSSG
ncbi:Xylulose kinase [Streptomyces alboniger]